MDGGVGREVEDKDEEESTANTIFAGSGFEKDVRIFFLLFLFLWRSESIINWPCSITVVPLCTDEFNGSGWGSTVGRDWESFELILMGVAFEPDSAL